MDLLWKKVAEFKRSFSVLFVRAAASLQPVHIVTKYKIEEVQ